MSRKTKKKMNKGKENTVKSTANGITLIALVVTIVVMIILATISISAVLGKNGILSKAKEEKDMLDKSITSKEESMNKLLQEYENMMAEEVEPPEPPEPPTTPEYKDDTLPTSPEVGKGMIKIKWDDTNKKWKKVTSDEEKWYDYSESAKQWANVVMGNESEIFNADGTLKEETGNNQYKYIQLVWIPRYAYKITKGYHSNTTGEIEVVFVDTQNNGKDIDNPSKTKEYSTEYPSISGDAMNDYVVHPAFIWGDQQVSGIWVAKFEASNSNCTQTRSTGEVRYTGQEIMTVKPNVTSWRDIKIGDMFDVCKNLQTNNTDPYDFAGTEPHLMKNSEWGAVAYLSHSSYGINGRKIGMNICKSFITGAGQQSDGSTSPYECDDSFLSTFSYTTANGKLVSTTGNEYGIYDMCGGAYDYVSAYVNNGSSNLSSNGQSLINEGVKSQYIDIYESTIEGVDTHTGEKDYELTNPINSSGHYGDAIFETSAYYNGGGGWFNCSVQFPWKDYPFFTRGDRWANYFVVVNLSSFKRDSGYDYSYDGFRPVLVVTEV